MQLLSFLPVARCYAVIINALKELSFHGSFVSFLFFFQIKVSEVELFLFIETGGDTETLGCSSPAPLETMLMHETE